MNHSIKEFKKEVYNIKTSLTRKDIMTSAAFAELSQAAVDAMTHNVGHVKNTNVYEPRTDLTAYSAGGSVVVNTGYELIESEPDHKKALLLVAGLRAHECGHELFTDHPSMAKYFDEYEDGGGKLFAFDSDDKERGQAMMEELNACPNKKEYMKTILKFIENAYEDAYVNNGIHSYFAGEPSVALRYLNDRGFTPDKSLEEFYNEATKKGAKLYSIMLELLHREGIGYMFKEEGKPLSPEAKALKERVDVIFDEIKYEREQLPYESDINKKYHYITKIFLRFYENMQFPPASEGKGSGEGEETDEQKEGSEDGNKASKGTEKDENTSGSGTSMDISSEELSKMAEDLKEESKLQTASKCGGGSLIKKPEIKKPSSSIDEKEKSKEEDKKEAVLNKIAAEIVINKETEKHEKELAEEANAINTKFGKSSKKFKLIYRKEDVSERSKVLVENVLRKNKKTISFLVRKLKTILKDRELDEFERGHYSGSRICVKDAVKPEMKVFSKRNEPTGKPNLRVCVLVDESGSMVSSFGSVERYEEAMKEAVIIHQVLNELEVEHCVIGHSADEWDYDELCLRNYVDYDNYDNKDIYRLGKISARSQNRDGAAITQCCEKMLKYPERKKLLIVISDGLPSHAGYFSSDPLQDTVLAVKQYRKKGIEIIAANMNQGNDQFKKIYGDKLFDCSTPEKFQKTLTNLIQKYVLAN